MRELDIQVLFEKNLLEIFDAERVPYSVIAATAVQARVAEIIYAIETFDERSGS
jgi:hypothetical protein